MDKIALITGANRGIGRATARRLGAMGVTVVMGSRDTAAGDRAVREFRRDGLDVESVQLDVTSSDSVRAASREVVRRHRRLDILVNNAGVLPEATATDATWPLDAHMFRTTFATNVLGAVTVIQEFLPLLRESDAGRIVNVSSMLGSLSDASDPSSAFYDVVVPAYRSSKAALNGITVSLAKQLADTSIKVNSICPGWVQTDLAGPDNRVAAPLHADEASGIIATMATLTDDGPTGQFVDSSGTVAW